MSRQQHERYSEDGGHGCSACDGVADASREQLNSAARKIARLKAKLQVGRGCSRVLEACRRVYLWCRGGN